MTDNSAQGIEGIMRDCGREETNTGCDDEDRILQRCGCEEDIWRIFCQTANEMKIVFDAFESRVSIPVQ